MAAKNHNIFHYIFTVFYVLIKGIAHSVIWIFVGYLGLLIIDSKKSPQDVIFGLPLLLIGGGLVVNHMWSVVLSVFYPPYNEGVCVFCRDKPFTNHVRLREILRR